MFMPTLIAAGGLLFAFEHATIAGKLVLLFLAVGSIFSWSIMVTKLRVIQFARKQNARFLAAFRQDRQPLRLVRKERALSRVAALQCLSRGLQGNDLSSARLVRGRRNFSRAAWTSPTRFLRCKWAPSAWPWSERSAKPPWSWNRK